RTDSSAAVREQRPEPDVCLPRTALQSPIVVRAAQATPQETRKDSKRLARKQEQRFTSRQLLFQPSNDDARSRNEQRTQAHTGLEASPHLSPAATTSER